MDQDKTCVCPDHVGYAGSYVVEDALSDKVKGNRTLSKEVKDVLANKKRADLVAGRVSAAQGFVLASDFCEFEKNYLNYRYKVVDPYFDVLSSAGAKPPSSKLTKHLVRMVAR